MIKQYRKKDSKTKTIIYFDAKMNKALVKLKEETDYSLSYIINHIVYEYFNKYQNINFDYKDIRKRNK